MPGLYNISLTRGDDYIKKFRFKTSAAGVLPEVYMDLTGATGRSQVRLTEDDTTVAMSATVTFGQDATGWYVQVNFPKAQTAALTAPTYVWDLEVTTAAEGTYTYLKGNLNVVKDVSRA